MGSLACQLTPVTSATVDQQEVSIEDLYKLRIVVSDGATEAEKPRLVRAQCER
jgi:hypothetical protein